MPRIVRVADVEWTGTVSRGSGVVSATSSGAFDLPVTLASRVAEPEGKTSPEELLAAAHASCFVTSLGSELHRAGAPAESVHVTCTITMDEVEGKGHLIVHSALAARVVAPDADEALVAAAAKAADDGCPFSSLIKGSATVSYDVALEGGA
ncbi:MAG TPA: OsmC family peroxiredoxin [Gaiellaceae bacterium]|nr:OsmC family peroxiredoxin [Gaiellaceae bacterium]